MAANYWTSTQYKYWLFTREKLAEIRQSVEESDKATIQQFPLPDLRLFNVYINQQLVKLGKRMNTRQQALATAQVYIKRFYTKVEIRRANPYVVVATAFYLACKTEECPQHIRLVVGEAKGQWPESIVADTAKIGEYEFWMISELNSQLIVHHPYRTLSELRDQFGLTADEVALSWSFINDHYLTDLPLLHPPHVIAVAAIVVAVVFKPGHPSVGSTGSGTTAGSMRDATANMFSLLSDKAGSNVPPRVRSVAEWLSTSEVDIEAVVECIQEVILLYGVWEQYSEKTCKEQITRYVNTRGLDK